jgi:hypothetical protein
MAAARISEHEATKEALMPSIDQQPSSQRPTTGHARSIAIGAAVAALVAIGVVLLVLFGGGGSSTGY